MRGKQRGKERKEKMVRERKKRGRKEKGGFPDVPTVRARRSKKKSCSTHRELHVGTKILEFRQTPRGRFPFTPVIYP